MRFRQYVWDPWLLVAQMVALQACFYLTMGVWIAAVTFIGVGHTVELQDMLTDAGMESAETGWFVVAAHLLTAATCGTFLVAVVGRAKLCLDFSVSMYCFHLGYCTAYSAVPRSALWWVVMVASAACTTVAGEYLCMRRELREIPIIGGNRGRAKEGADNIQMTDL